MSHSTVSTSIPAARASAAVCPTDPTAGSVKVTCGKAGDHVASDARLVLAHVGQQRAPAQVADGVEPVAACDGQVVVDVEVAVLACGHANGVQAKVVAVRRPPRGHHDLIGRDRRAILERDRHLAAVHVPLAGVARPLTPHRRRPRTEPFAGELVAEQFGKAGIDVRLGARAASVRREGPRDTGEGHVHGGEVTLTLEDGTLITADEIVVAAGRTPNSEDLGLDTVGVTAGEHGYLDVDDHLTVTGSQWLYAVGDLCGRALLTHMGKYQARIAGDVIAARAAGRPLDDTRFTDRADHGVVPQVTFTNPEVGSVGQTAAQARAAGIDVETVESDIGSVAGAALLRDDYLGQANLVIDRASDTLVGATFVGSGIAELVHSATVAVIGRVPVSTLWHAVPSYPTVSEIWLRLLEALRAQRTGS